MRFPRLSWFRLSSALVGVFWVLTGPRLARARRTQPYNSRWLMRATVHQTVRLPVRLRAQLAAVAEAESRSFSAILVAILDRGIVERAKEAALVEEWLAEQETTQQEAA
jgi:hypothetical protein